MSPPPATDVVDAGQITLVDAAEQLGVHYMTAYRYVRTGRMLAEKRAGKWWVAPDDLAAVVAEGTGARRREAGSDQAPRKHIVAPFADRLMAGDTAGCWDMVTDALSSGAGAVEVQQKLLRPAMVYIGEGWARGDITIADEHRASATVLRLLGQMGPLFRHRGQRRGTIVLAACAGDPHGLPTAMMADLLSDRRFDVVDLGANTPTESIVAVASGCDNLVGVGISLSLTEVVPRALAQLQDLREALPDVCLVVGGPAMGAAPSDVFESVVDRVSLDANDACEAFERVLAAAPVAG